MKEHLRKNWKTYLLTAASAGAGAYAGPAGSAAAQELLPQIARFFGLS